MIILIISAAIWFLIGYLAWRVRYYSLLKSWYIQFREDYREFNNGKNGATEWGKWWSLLICTFGGLVTFLIIATGEEYFIFNYKIPTNASKEKS